jgi:predicted phage terminase large subunit-like protein
MKTKNSRTKFNFKSFLIKCFETLNPGEPFIDNWHIDAMISALEEIEKGKIKRLIINIPPRHLKSQLISVAWAAWLMGRNPTTRIIASSYNQALSEKHSIDCRNIIKTSWYKKRFPKLVLSKDQNKKNKFSTTKNGFRLATSTMGTLTGEGGDILIVDDPHNPAKIFSKTYLERCLSWFDQVLCSRLNNKSKGAIVVIMQRLHTKDLTGHLQNKKLAKWTRLCLPAIFERKATIEIGKFKKIIQQDELLNPLREDSKTLALTKDELGSFAFSSQYLQKPTTTKGVMIKKDWITKYLTIPDEHYQCIQSWDTAIKISDNSDYSVGTSWIATKEGYYLVDLIRERFEFPELRRAVINFAKTHNPSAILIEDKSSGQSLIQDLRKTTLPIIGVHPRFNKETRLAAITPIFESKRVFIPDKPWTDDFIAELISFPYSSFDDQVDSTSQFFDYISRRRLLKTPFSSVSYP